MHALLLVTALFMGRSAKPAASPVVVAAASAGEPSVGAVAPDFTLPNPMGGNFHLGDFAGKKSVVLVFYPKAFTGG